MPNLGNHVDAVFIPESVNTSTTLKINGGDLNVNNGQFFVDQSTTNVGIGTTQPQHLLDIWGDGPDTAQLTLRQWNNNPSNVQDGPDMRFIASGGTIASPAEMDDNDVIGKVNAFAYDGTSSVQYGGFGWRYRNQGFGRGSSFSIETKSVSETSNSAKIHISEEGAVGIGTTSPISVNLQINGFYNSGTSEYGAPTQYFYTNLSSVSSGTNIGRVIFARNGDSAVIAAKSTGTANETDLYFYNRTSGGGDNVNNILNTTPTLKLYHDKTAEFASDVNLPDDAKLLLGTDDDFQIYYDGGTAHIDNNQGQIRMRAASSFLFYYEGSGGNEDYAKFLQNAAVELYYNNSKKFETTSTGVDVIGDDIRALGPTSGSTFTTATLTLRGYRQSSGVRFGTLSFNNIDKNSSNTEYVGARIDASATGNDGGELKFFVTPDSSTTLNTTPSLILHNDSSAEFAGAVKLGDGDILHFGASNGDLQIYHSGYTSYIIDADTGGLEVRSNGPHILFENINGTDQYAVFNDGGSVELYHNASKKFETTSTGVSITGVVSGTSLSTGASGTGVNISTNTISGPATLTLDPAAVGDNTGTVVIAGNLQVDGTTTTINSTTLTVDDKNIVLASGAANSAAADGAGVTIDGANESLTWVDSSESFKFSTRLTIGSASSKASNLRLSKDLGGESVTTYYGLLSNGLVQPDVTGTAYYNFAQVRTDGNSGTAYTINNIHGYAAAVGTNAISADSTITNLTAFNARNSWTAGTNNYGFRGEIADAANRWNVYMDGTAPNYFAGNVGIGAIDPDEKLVVADVAASSGFSQTSVRVLRSNYGGQIGGYIDQGVGHGLTFSTVGSGTASERLRIDSTGNVGIGTTAPTVELEVVATSPEIKARATGNSSANLALESNRGADVINSQILGKWDGTSIAAIRFHNADDAVNKDNGDITFSTALAGTLIERMRILDSGNVGIGTNAPADKLHVVGSIKIEGTAPIIKLAETGVTGNPSWWIVQDAGNFSLRNNNTSPYAFNVATKGTNKDTTDYVSFGGDTIADVVKITAHGTNPTYLDLKGNNANARMRYFEGATERWNIGYDISSNAFTFYDVQSSTARMTLYDNPNNGIVIGAADNGALTWPSTDGGGATAQQAALRVDGGNNVALFCYNNEQSGDPVAVFAKGNEADDNQVVIIASDGDGDEELLDIRSSTNPPNSASLLSFAQNNANSKFRVYGDGRVYTPYRIGIGTTDPSSPLDVIGNISVSGTVDGRDVAADGTKLDGIETGATADQTAAEILTAIKTVDGSGSGLDADTLDGVDSGSFLRSDANDTATGSLSLNGGIRFDTTNAGGNGISFVDNGSQTRWDGRESNNRTIVYKFSRQGYNTGAFNAYVENWYDGSTYHSIGLNSSGVLEYDSNTVWHAGNDGATSTLDADLLDGQEGSFYQNATNLTSGTIPDARITDIGDSQARIITLDNLEKSDLTADGQLSFDSSQGLLVYRVQQGTPGAATTVLDGWNVAAGTGISITNLGAGGGGTGEFTFSLATIAGASDYGTLLRSDTSDTMSGSLTVTGVLSVGSELNLLGTSDANKYIDCRVGTNALSIRKTTGGDAGHENMARFVGDGGVELYYNNVKKFETTSTGATLDDTLTISGDPSQMLLHPGTNAETVIVRNDGATMYFLLSNAGASPSGTWNTLRPLYINTSTGHLHSNNGQSFAGGLTTTGAVTIDVDNVAAGALSITANQTNPNNDFYFAQEIVSTLSGTTTTTGDREQGGIYMDINSTATGGDTANEHRTYGMYIDLDVTGDADVAYGIYADSTATPTTGTVSTVTGIYGRAEDNGGAGSTTNIHGVRGEAYSDNSTSDVNNMYGGYFRSVNVSDTGNIAAAHGCYAEIEIPANTGDHYGTSYVFRAEYDNNDVNTAQTNTTYLFYGNYAGIKPTTAYGIHIDDDVPNYFGGNVGIGTNSPDTKLDVSGTIKTETITYGNNQDLPYLIAGSTSYTGATTNWGTYGIQHRFKSNSGGTSRVTIDTTSGEAFCVNNSGKVGIGQSAPSHLLHIGSTSNVLGGTAGDQLLNLRIQSDTANADHLDFTTRRTSTGLSVDWTNAAQRIQRKVDSSQMGYIQFGHYDSGTNNGLITFGENESEYVRIDGVGNVGIGTASPSTKLDVNGNIHCTKLSAGTAANPGSNLDICLGADNDTGFACPSDGTLEFWANNAEVAQFTNTGINFYEAIYSNQNIQTSGAIIECGEGSGSVALTINDGKGNANLTFNHASGVPDNTASSQSAGRIECGVDATNARMYFELGDSTSNGVSVNLTNVMDLDIGVVNVSGNLTATGTVTGGSSDGRLKENLVRISTPLDKVDQLHGYTFDWKAECADVGFTPVIQTNDIGLIAQDVQAVVPQAVAPAPFDHELSDDGTEDVSITGETYLTVQYERLVPLLVEAIKELRQEVESLKSQISGP